MVIAFTKVRLPFGWLGNMNPFPLAHDGKVWPTAEHLFQALRFEDGSIREAIAIPGDGQIGFEENTYPPSPLGSPPGWSFPDGTVLVKTFAMDMERGNPLSRRRLETRILHFQKGAGVKQSGERHWRGYTYVWNEEQTDAELLDAAGADKLLKIKVGDKTVEQNYRFPSRAQCTHCHTVPARFALGVNTLQMNRDHNYDGVIANQLATLEHIGLFTKKLPGRQRTCQGLPITPTRLCRWESVPVRTCTPIAAIAIPSGEMAGSSSPRHSPSRTWQSSTRSRTPTSGSRTAGSSCQAIRSGRYFIIACRSPDWAGCLSSARAWWTNRG
jgi:hypothetical protein